MKRPVDTDSEDDEDYVPPGNDEEGSSSGSEDAGDISPILVGDEKKEKKNLSKVWQDFQASVSGQPSTTTSSEEVKVVKVVRKYRFAGEEHEETVEVPENSGDAKKWPHYQDPAVTVSSTMVNSNPGTITADTSASVAPADQKSTPAHLDTQPTPSTSTPPTDASVLGPVPPKRKPGPRKSKTTLAPLPSASSKAKKITTLEKSAMDWSKHVTPTDKDELEAQRRGGGGYLDKVEFLNRVEERKESVLSESSTSKRRRL